MSPCHLCECADQWSESINESDYIGLAELLYKSVLDADAKGVWRDPLGAGLEQEYSSDAGTEQRD